MVRVDRLTMRIVGMLVLYVVAAVFGLATLALATFTPKGTTFSNLLGVYETASPTSDSRDRPLVRFTNPDGTAMVLIYKDTTKALVAVTESAGATLATSTTTTSTSTSSSTST